MPYRLKHGEPVTDSVERVAREQLTATIRALAHTDRAGAVHDVRKRLKKLRAVLKLVRPGLSDKQFERENEAFRHIGRRLAELRDTDALVHAVASLETPQEDVQTVRHLLAAARARRGQARRSFFSDRHTVRALHEAAIEARHRLSDWTRPADVDAAVVEGLRRSYARARKTFNRARRSHDDDLWHEWRKRAKDFGYHLRLLQSVWPAMFQSAQAQCGRLTEVLGEMHDLAGVEQFVHELAPRAAPLSRRGVAAAIARRKHALESEARKAACLLFQQKPKAFSRHLRRSWDVWRG